MNNKILEEIFYNPKYGLLSSEKFILKVQKLHPEITTLEIKQFLENQEIVQLSKKPIVSKDKMYKINGPELSFQIDLMFVPRALKTASDNNSFYIFLLCVDILSRKAYIYYLTDKKKDSILEAYTLFLKDLDDDVAKYKDTINYYDRDKPYAIIADDGFNFKEFNELNERLDIILDTKTANDDHIIGGNRLGIIDRLVRTLKNILTKFVFATSGNQYSIKNTIKDIVESYNDTPHRSLNNFTPNDIFSNKEARLHLYTQNKEHNEELNNNIKIQVGDTVRILNKKETFDKEKPQFSKELYKITDTSGYKFIVESLDGNTTLRRRFGYNELMKVNINTIERKNSEDKDKTIKENRTKTKTAQELKKLDIDENNILSTKRIRTLNPKYI